MLNDPIVASVRKTRDELAAAFDYDVHAMFTDLRKREAGLGDRLLKQPEPLQPEHASRLNGDSGVGLA
jgi:hypothetical protein